MSPSLIPHLYQERAVAEVLAAIARGERTICLTSPTGGGKTLLMQMLAQAFLETGDAVSLYTNRKLLVQQTSDAMLEAGFYHGIRAAGHEAELGHPFQISSVDTEYSRVVRKKRWPLHRAKLVLVDEGHLQKGETAQTLFAMHRTADDAAVVWVTATPVDMADVCTLLVTAGLTDELVKCGMLVTARHYAPDEPDPRRVKAAEGKDLTEGQARDAMNCPVLVGRVWEWFEKLNPERLPTLLFAPGLPESVWFCERFAEKGVRAAHIDGEHIWLDGELHRSTEDLRAEVLRLSKSGEVTILSNRFVLREGINAPWLRHCIFATVFGSLQTYLQSGGRMLRAFPGKEFCTIQDHGGNWWRHGSLNENREWSLEWPPAAYYGVRAQNLRNNPEQKPWRCPRCQRVCRFYRCSCGFVRPVGQLPPRAVVTVDGKLREHGGDVFTPRRVTKHPSGEADWGRMYWRSVKHHPERTFQAAMALFAKEHDWGWPDQNWALMPTNPVDFYREIGKVPITTLKAKEAAGDAV